MSDKPVWMEDIEIGPDATPESGMRNLPYYFGTFTPEQFRLFAASSALVRALLKNEWTDEGGCIECDGFYPTCTHDLRCSVDVALTKADFPDQASRDAAREMIRKETRR